MSNVTERKHRHFCFFIYLSLYLQIRYTINLFTILSFLCQTPPCCTLKGKARSYMKRQNQRGYNVSATKSNPLLYVSWSFANQARDKMTLKKKNVTAPR